MMIHGNAAYAGQCVVMETIQMSQTRAYKVGGTVHIIINNQVGFTTSKREDARSTEYCTDVAKMVQAPIFHVNGEDPEAVFFVTQLAADYRMQFTKDVGSDLVCYRRLGHDEADEPSATQRMMYKKIKAHRTTRTLYAERLITEKVITEAESEQMDDAYRDALTEGHHVVEKLVLEPNKAMYVDWGPYLDHKAVDEWDTTLDRKRVQELANKLAELPEGFEIGRAHV